MCRRIKFSNNDTSLMEYFNTVDENGVTRFQALENVMLNDANFATATKNGSEYIRHEMFRILGVEENCNPRELRKAIRRHKVEVFEVMENVLDNLVKTGWQENPFFMEFVETRNLADGDSEVFYVEDDIILTVSELSGNHHNLIRQRLGNGRTFTVKTSWYGAKIYAEYELFMMGRVDWASFILKIYEAFDKKINNMLYQAVMSASTAFPPNSSQWLKTAALSASTKEDLLRLYEDVSAANNGSDVVIMGTRVALSKVISLCDVEWISDQMKEERHTTGRIAICDGMRLVEIPQAFADNDTTTRLVADNKLLIMPCVDNKFVKLVNEGDAQVAEVTDGTTNGDKTISYEYQVKMGIATVINRRFGVWTIM